MEFHRKFLTGKNPSLNLDKEFLKKHMKVLLRSEKSDRIWKVKLNGNRLSGAGWEEFAAVTNFRDGDVLVFISDGDENFHVSVSSSRHTSLSYVDNNAVNKKRQEAESSLGHSCFITASVTRYSLDKDRLDLSKDFNRVYFGDEDKKPDEMDLVNERGRRWTLHLARNKSSGVFYIRNGWRNFCFSNELSIGDLCKFKLVENEERHVLCLCPQDRDNGREEAAKNGGCNEVKSTMHEASKKAPSQFTSFYSDNRFKSGQLSIPFDFIRENDINCGEMILCDKHGRKWSSYLQNTQSRGNKWFYLRRGWREMCYANGVKVNDSFVLELIWNDDQPMFKFFSKIENKGEGTQRTRKRRAGSSVDKTPRVKTEEHASKRACKRPLNQANENRGFASTSNATTSRPREPQCKQPESFSFSDKVANVKRGVVETLETVRRFRLELETREQNLEASLMEMDALGERILGINKILNNTLV